MFVEVLEVLEMLEVMRCVLLCILEIVEGGLCLLEAPKVPEAMRLCATLCAGGCGRAGDAEGDALCAALYTGGCGGCALFAGGAGGARGDALAYYSVCWRLWTVGSVCWTCWGNAPCALPLCMLEAVEGGFCLLEMPEIRCMILCMLEAADGGFCLLEVIQWRVGFVCEGVGGVRGAGVDTLCYSVCWRRL